MDSKEQLAKYHLDIRGDLQGHNGWVTCMQVGEEQVGPDEYREFLISGSRDHSLIIWDIKQNPSDADDDKEWGVPRKILKGHSHFISDIALSNDSRFCLSSSWDGTIRLWNLTKAKSMQTFIGHQKDVMTVAFSPDNRQIVSGSIDKSIKIWNINGVCKFTVEHNAHTDWVSCVRFYHDVRQPIIVSASWDRSIKVWDNKTMSLMHTFYGHKAQVNCLDLAQNTMFVASGGRDGKVNIWNLVEGKHLDELDAESPVNVLLFATKIYWLVIGTEDGIKVYDLPKQKFVNKYRAQDLDGTANADGKETNQRIGCTSLAWSKDQQHLYSGWTDGKIRVLSIVTQTNETE